MKKLKLIFFGILVLLGSLALAQTVFKANLYFLNASIPVDAVVIDGRVYVPIDQVQIILNTIELLPQLKENQATQITAVKRAIQVHSANVYKAAIAIYATYTELTIGAIAEEIDKLCRTGQAVNNIVINGIKSDYGFGGKPNIVQQFSCSVSAEKDDFLVMISGDPGDGRIWISLNGQPPYIQSKTNPK